MPSTKKNPISSGGSRKAWVIASVVAAVVVAAIIAIVLMRPSSSERLAQEADFSHFDGIEVAFADQDSTGETPGTITFQREGGAEEGAGVANLAEDPYCSYCADLNKASSESALAKMKDGKLVMKIHLASVTEDNSKDNGPSRTAIAAIVSAARAGDASTAWGILETNYRDADKTYTMSLSDYRDFASSVTDNAETLSLMEDEQARYDDAKFVWESTHKYLKDNAGEVSTPTLLDGDNNKVESLDTNSDSWVYAVSAP